MTELTIPRQQISILAGASGAGKTTLLLQILASWSRGEIFTPAVLFEAKKVAYLVADRTAEEVQIRRTRLAIPEEKMEVYGLTDDSSFNLDLLDVPAVALKHILDTKFSPGFDMLVIDPLGLFLGNNTNDYVQIAKSLIRFNRLAKERGITILATHHATKMKTDASFLREQDRISGSAALQGYSGTQMVLVEGSEQKDHIDTLSVIPHMASKMAVKLTRDEKGDFLIVDGPAAGASGKSYDGVLKFLELFAPGEKISIHQFHAHSDKNGIERSQTFKNIEKLIEAKLIVRIEKGSYCKPLEDK